MSIVKITDLPDVIHNNGDGSELGQIVQGDESKKAVLLFSDSSNKEFVVPYDYSIKAATDSGNKNLVEMSRDGLRFYIGPKNNGNSKPVTDLVLSGVVLNDVSVDYGHTFDGWTKDREQKSLVGIGIDNKVTVGNPTSSIVLIRGPNQSASVRREITPGSDEWADHCLVDDGNIKDYIVLHMHHMYTYGTEEPQDDDGYPDGHLYLKY